MLTWLRGASGSLLVKLLLVLLVASFAVWGISGQVFTGAGNHVIAVGDTRVSPTEYRLAYDRRLQMLSQQFGGRITREQARAMGLEQQVLAGLVAGAVLDEQAREMNLGLSRDRLARLTAEDPAFQNASGQFDRNQFDFVLQQVGMRPQDYFATREQAAVRQQIVDATVEGMAAPSAFLEAVALYRGEDRTAEFIALPRSIVEPIEEPSDEELASYFEENADAYAAPEYRSIVYARLEPEDIADPAQVSDAQIEEYYETHRDSFATAERREIMQLVFPSQEEAEAAAQRIAEGEADFLQIAEEMGRSAQDLSLGTLTRQEVPDPAIAEAAFALEEGGTSDVVDGAFGPVIVRVGEIDAGETPELAEVEDQIRQEIALDEANRILLDVYDAYEDARAGGASLAEAAREQGLEVVEIEAVDSSGMTPAGEEITDLPGRETLLADAFEAEAGLENPAISLPSGGYVFYEVTEVTPARDRELEEVREAVVADWKDEEARSRLAARAEELRTRVAEGASLAEIAEEIGREVQVKRGLARGGDDADLGRDGVAAAFTVPEGGTTTVATQGGDVQIVLQVTEVFAPADASAESLPDNVTEAYADAYANGVLDQLVARLQAGYDVMLNQRAIQQAQSF